jgi:hypothetical protein
MPTCAARGAVPAAAVVVAVLAAVLAVPTAAAAALPGANGLIAFASDRGGVVWDLYTMRPDGSQVSLVLSTGSVIGEPSWSPDGGRIAFTSGAAIWVVDADGGDPRALTSGAEDTSPSWSPDGSRIVFDREVDDETQLAIVEVASGAVTPLTTQTDRAEDPTWSSTGRIAFVEGEFIPFPARFDPHLALINPDGTGFARVPGDLPASVGSPDWAPDGSRIVFTGFDDANNPELFTIAADGSGLTNLTANPALHERDPAFSPDGTMIAFTSAEDSDREDEDIFVMPAGGGTPTNIVTGEGSLGSTAITDYEPAWQPIGGSSPPPTTPPTTPPAPPPTGTPATPVTFDGDPATTERLDTADPTAGAIAISQARFPTGGQRAALHVVLSRDDDFPDSLTGSSLTGDGPLLFTDTAALPPQTRAEIDRVLDPGGTVYLLGGTGAIGPAVEQELRAAGYAVVRLAGPSRVETALAIADETRRLYDTDSVFLARERGVPGNETSGWADSVSAGGLAAFTAIPILVTGTDALHPAVESWLDANAITATTLLGGEAALSPAVAAAVPNPVRVAGAERTETAARISTDLWGVDRSTPDRWFVIINGQHPQGWAFGLAGAGLSSDALAPVLLVGEQVSPATADLAGACGSPQVDALLLGATSLISADVQDQLEAADGGSC